MKLWTRLFVGVMLLAGLCSPGKVSAHATPLEYWPEPGSTLDEIPQEIAIRFSERLEPDVVELSVRTQYGRNLPVTPTVAPNNPYVMTFDFPGQTVGAYTITWRVLSKDDDHFSQGSYNFYVAWYESDPYFLRDTTSVVTSHDYSFVQGLTVGIELIGLSLLAALYLLPLVSFGPLVKTEKGLVRLGILMASLGIVIYSLLQFLEFHLSNQASLSQNVMSFIQTTGLQVNLLKLLGLLVLGVFGASLSAIQNYLILLGIILLRSRVSHASAASHWWYLATGLSAVHILAKTTWLGLVLVLLKNQSAKLKALYKKVSYQAFVFGGATGIYIVWLHLKETRNIWFSQWGEYFGLLSLLTGMFLLGHALMHNKITRTRVRFMSVCSLAMLILSGLLAVTKPPSYPKQNWTATVSTPEADFTLYTTKGFDQALVLDLGQEDPLESVTLVTEAKTQPLNTIRRTDSSYYLDLRDVSDVAQAELHFSTKSMDERGKQVAVQIPLEEIVHRQSVSWFKPYTIVFALSAGVWLYLFYFWKKDAYYLQGLSLLARFALDLEKKITAMPRIVSIFALIGTVVLVYTLAITSLFKWQCLAKGYDWHHGLPQYAGVVTGLEPVTGCWFSPSHGNDYLLADPEHFSFVTRPKEVVLDLLVPEELTHGSRPQQVIVTLQDSEGNPISEIDYQNPHWLQTTIVSQDLRTASTSMRYYADKEMIKTGQFPLELRLYKTGVYALGISAVIGDQVYERVFALDTGTQAEESTDINFEPTKDFGDYSTTMSVETPVQAREVSTLNFEVLYQDQPLTNMISGHESSQIIVVKTDQTQILTEPIYVPQLLQGTILDWQDSDHQHAYLPPEFGPKIASEVVFPEPGIYAIYLRVQTYNDWATFTFYLEVE